MQPSRTDSRESGRSVGEDRRQRVGFGEKKKKKVK